VPAFFVVPATFVATVMGTVAVAAAAFAVLTFIIAATFGTNSLVIYAAIVLTGPAGDIWRRTTALIANVAIVAI
jgi:hypothetical protein